MSDLIMEIRNYQRIKKAKFRFVPGLNVIVGSSNQGKSSTGRALETAVYNVSRERHVTIGEVKSMVAIKYNNHEVIWRRDTTAASQVAYRVDGKIYKKLGKGQPEVVADALGIREVDINDTKFHLNFAKQMAYPFLLDFSPTDLFRFVMQSSEEDNVLLVLKKMMRDVVDMNQEVEKDIAARDQIGVAYKKEVANYRALKKGLPYCDKIIQLFHGI